MNTSHAQPPLAVLWDFGGVILSSPFEAFRLYEREAKLPEDFIRMLNARNPDTNAWAKMERSDVSLAEFVALFEAEAEAHGHRLDGWQVLKAISGDIRPQMVEALRRCKAAFKVACITNNMNTGEGPGMARSPEKAAAVAEVMTLFEHVVESSKVGFRLEQDDEFGKRYVASFHFRPRIRVRIACIQPADEIFGNSCRPFIQPKSLERARENDPAEVPQDGEGRLCMARIHHGATVFTLFLPQSALISRLHIGDGLGL